MARAIQHPHRGSSPEPDALRPPLGGARNEAIGLFIVLMILTIIAAGFFWESRTRSSAPHPLPAIAAAVTHGAAP